MAMYRAKTLIESGGFSTNLQLIAHAYEDYELWVRLGAAGYAIKNIPHTIGNYFHEENSLITYAKDDELIVRFYLRIRTRLQHVFRMTRNYMDENSNRSSSLQS
jgi:hypothetical protein